MSNNLQIATTRKLEMSKGQKHLLETICKCLKDNRPLLLEDIVICYYLGVKKTLYWTNFQQYHGTICAIGPHKEYDILVEYTANSFIWNKKIKDLIKSWFVSAIGLLVIEGRLNVLPSFNINI